MELTINDTGNVRVITVGDNRIDAAVAIQFKDKMRDLSEGAPGRIILDMTNVDFLDSSGLGAVVAVMKQISASRSFELAGLTTNVRKVFSLTRMDTVFTIHADAQTALGGGLASAS